MARDVQRNRERRSRGGSLKQLPWRQYRNPYRPIEVLTEDQVEAIHLASLKILEDYGMEFLDAGARDRLRAAGARMDADNLRVRFDRGFILEHVAKVPAEVTLHARNPERSLVFGGNTINFGSVASAPNCSDMDKGRRPGSFEDYCNLLRLCQSLNIVHFIAGYPVEPADLPASTRHLDAHYAAITLTDRIWHPYSLGRERIADGIEMCLIARGIDRETLAREPGIFSVVNSNSPLRLDMPMLQGMTEMALHRQPVVMTPFTLSGAMAPATVAGALAQQNAEALAGIAYMQVVNPGCPAMYGGFTSNVDMKTGAPAFGTPEYTRAAMAGGQLARRYKIPYRSSNACAANTVDAQAAYESEMSIWGAVMGHANMVMHGAGWMEGGLVASFEKVILDAEMLQGIGEFMQPLVVDADTLALEAIGEVGPGGHFFGVGHTLARYETAFYAPILSDWRNYESWREAGALTAAQRANAIWKQLLAEYQPPPLDPAKEEALREYVERRKREGGVKT
ncbi:MAG TPA: trimethylamine methyltransferase family protein [Candidatus Udaeobacter sp.]|nr:trimethylamine methyltransferase family protein [Candidatus Udaeobacter sp.]